MPDNKPNEPEGGSPEAGKEKDLHKGQENNNQDVDYYKVELERLQDRVKSANGVIVKLKQENKELQREDITDETTKDELRAFVKDEMASLTKEVKTTLLKSQARQTAENLAQTKEEADLIMWHFDHSISPTGDLKEDMENAQVIANKKRIKQQLEEVKRAQEAGELVGTAGAGVGQKLPDQVKPPVYDAATQERIAKSNLKFDPKTKKYISPAKQKYQEKLKQKHPGLIK